MPYSVCDLLKTEFLSFSHGFALCKIALHLSHVIHIYFIYYHIPCSTAVQTSKNTIFNCIPYLHIHATWTASTSHNIRIELYPIVGMCLAVHNRRNTHKNQSGNQHRMYILELGLQFDIVQLQRLHTKRTRVQFFLHCSVFFHCSAWRIDTTNCAITILVSSVIFALSTFQLWNCIQFSEIIATTYSRPCNSWFGINIECGFCMKAIFSIRENSFFFIPGLACSSLYTFLCSLFNSFLLFSEMDFIYNAKVKWTTNRYRYWIIGINYEYFMDIPYEHGIQNGTQKRKMDSNRQSKGILASSWIWIWYIWWYSFTLHVASNALYLRWAVEPFYAYVHICRKLE